MRWLAVFLIWVSRAAAATCENVSYAEQSFSICSVDSANDDLRLFHTDPTGAVLGSFSVVEKALDGDTLGFAMNAGMYHSDRRPVGHYVENGVEKMRVITSEGPGNFGLLPNGILCIADDNVQVYETLDFVAKAPTCQSATQSGPMLVIDGALHPRFLANSTSRHIRNGVGTSLDGKWAVFAISNQPVSFYEFGSFFKDFLDLPNALYFDGKVSRLYAPALGRSDAGFPMGPIVGVVNPTGDGE